MKEIILEDKVIITEALLDLLKLTRAGAQLESLTYSRDPETFDEMVTAQWMKEDGLEYYTDIDVTADSGIALIKDVIRAIGE